MALSMQALQNMSVYGYYDPMTGQIRPVQALKNLQQIHRDSAQGPLQSDYRIWSTQIVRLFRDQARVGRQIVPMTETIAFDGTIEHETPTLNRIPAPEYGMEPDDVNINIEGSSVIVKLPELYTTIKLKKDRWARVFAGQERVPLIVAQAINEFKNAEDRIIWRGRGPITGLVGSLTHDLGNPAGNWGIDSGGDGILENVFTDVSKGKNWFLSQNIPAETPIDVVLTSYLWTLLSDKISVYSPGTNNLDILRGKLNGGTVYVTNNLQDAVLSTANTMVMIAKTTQENAAWEILSSGIEQRMLDLPAFKQGLEMRQKFSVKVLQGDYIAWMDGINDASS